jgi:hypothetical protein
MSDTSSNQETIRFIDYYQTPLNAGTYEVTATLNEPDALDGANISTSTTVKFHLAGPRFFLPPSEIYSVFPPENGAGDYNNILPHIVFNRHTLPWERLIAQKSNNDDQDEKLEKTPFLALLVFSEDEETNGYNLNLMALNNATDLPLVGNGLVFVAKVGEFYHARIFDRTGAIVVGNGNSQFSPSRELEETLLASFKDATIGTAISVNDQTQRDIIRKITSILGHLEANSDVTPPSTISLADLLIDPNFKYALEPGEKLTDKVNVIDVKPSLLEQIMPKGKDLCLLAHGREQIQNGIEHKRAVVIANRLPATPPQGESKKRNIAHLVMLENRYQWDDDKQLWSFPIDQNSPKMVRLVCLKSWQFTCTTDEPTLKGRLLNKKFTFELFCVPKSNPQLDIENPIERIRLMSYAALPYHLRSGDQAHTLYCGPLVASSVVNSYPNENAVRDISDAEEKLEKAKKDLLNFNKNDSNLTKAMKDAEIALNNIIDKQIPASADGLIRLIQIQQDKYIFDVSLAAAWQLGQMLMLRDQSVAMEYFGWRRRDAQIRARDAIWEADGHLHVSDNAQIGQTALPKNVQDWCQKRLELHGLPFEYLVPDARMLPENSLRIFRINKTWLECLLSGALAVGRGGDKERCYEAEYRSVVYSKSTSGQTGFLLRSPAVNEHPDLKVVAEGTTKEIRLEKIADGILLGIYEGKFNSLEFSLPPIGLHFGFREENYQLFKDVKDNNTGKNTGQPIALDNRIINDKRTVNISNLCDQIGNSLTSGSFVFQMCEGTELVKFNVSSG